MGDYVIRRGVQTNVKPDGMWSFGIGFTHCLEENYFFINFYKWSVYIGKFIDAA